MQYGVTFGSSFSVDQFGFVRRGVITTEADTITFWGYKSWSWLAKFGVFVLLTIVLLMMLRVGLLEPFIALVVIHYFCASRGSLSIQRSSIINVHREGRWMRFTGKHPESGKDRRTVFKVDTEQAAISLESELSSSHNAVQQTQQQAADVDHLNTYPVNGPEPAEAIEPG